MAFPVDEQFVERVEIVLGRRLPDVVRNRLLRNNGGEVEAADETWLLFPVRDPTDRKRLARTGNDIVRETEQARSWPRFPPEAIALAADGSGDLIILRSGKDDPDLWFHETGEFAAVLVDWS